MATSSARVGIPGIIAAARGRYAARVRELEDSLVCDDEADAVILAEARAAGGVRRDGETIDLRSWSERFGIPRAVLEALVLAIGHEEVATPPPSVREPAITPPPPPSPWPGTMPMTPAPNATRRPRFDPEAGPPTSR